VVKLSQYKVLITRPQKQQEEFAAALEAVGVSSVSWPMIAIEPLESPSQIETIKARIQQLDNYRFLIFVSSNAATLGAHWIDQYWPQFPHLVELIALGPTTSHALTQHLGCPVIQPSTGITSEDVLKLPQLKSLSGQKIAIFRGSGGRELLAETLTNRGAQVDYIEVYARSMVHYDAQQLAAGLRAERVNIISANSVETVKSLIANLGSHCPEFAAMPLLVPSARVVSEAKTLGFANPIDCVGADINAVIAALKRLADTNR
jgi:uroporphyrinogen-III synthase